MTNALDAKILVVKVGALGDVLRTTSALRVLGGRLTWMTSEAATPLLAGNPFVERLYCKEHYPDSLLDEEFDLIVNLEDDISTAALASRIKTKCLVGAYLREGKLVYTESASEWFDMSLISGLGKKRADELKMNNRKSYQEFLFSMLGHRFRGEEYLLNMPFKTKPIPGLVGLEVRAGDVWPMKRWNKFEALTHRLIDTGFKVRTFQQRAQLQDYVDDICECEYVVSGDTLAMHLGLALRKKVVAIFTCTSPHEIYDYQRMIKVVSPLWKEYFYRRDFDPAPAEAISVETVFDAVMAVSKSAISSEDG